MQDLVEFVASWILSGKKLRMIVTNTCRSAHIAKALSKYVDYVLAHTTRVKDESAVKFARELYGFLGKGESLAVSFALS